jgi:4-hydroxybenzoate polyprenyltransferase
MLQLLIDLRLSYAVVSSGLVLLGFFWNNLEGFDMQYLVLIVSIFCANVFMFVVNDFYDAPHDVEDYRKRIRNVFCSLDTRMLGKVTLYASLGLSLLLGAVVSLSILSIIIIFNLLAFSYSAPPIKLRNRAYWDWIFVFLWKGLIISAGYIYFFGTDLHALNSFIVWTLAIILLFSLIGQLDNQLRDFEVDRTTNSGHSVQRLGPRTSSYLKTVLLVFFFASSLVFCYLFGFYITFSLIVFNVSLYYFASSHKYSHILDFAAIWIVVLFLEHFKALFSFQQQLLFSVWVVTMGGIAILHAKRKKLFEDELESFS